MSCDQIIQIIFSGALVSATGTLAYITYRYMKATKRIANSMEVQSKIMQREFELRVAPLIDIHSGISSTTHEKGDYRYNLSNQGGYSVYLKKVEVVFWHKTNQEINIPSYSENYNYLPISPKSPKEILPKITFSKLNRVLLDVESKKEVLMQPIFYFRDVEQKDHQKRGPIRTVWS
jgi:hypothetical protein